MKIWGYALKVYNSKQIHLPRNLLRIYGFENGTQLIRQECNDGFYFRLYNGRPIQEGENIIKLRCEKITLPSQWLIRNGLQAGLSVVYLTATEEGFYILTTPEFPGTIK